MKFLLGECVSTTNFNVTFRPLRRTDVEQQSVLNTRLIKLERNLVESVSVISETCRQKGWQSLNRQFIDMIGYDDENSQTKIRKLIPHRHANK